MVANLNTVISRGERLELLIDKTDNLSTQSRAFRTRSTALRRQMWWKNIKVMILSGLVGLVLFYFLMSSFCGFSLQHCSS